MMRRLSYGLVFLLMLVSCVGRLDEPSAPYIELTLSCDNMLETKADKDGDDYYRENRINTVDFFFYNGRQPDRDAPASYHKRCESGQDTRDVFRIELTSEDINTKIFPSSPIDYRQATVFAVVNWPGSPLVANEANLSGTSLNQLAQKVATADFASPEDHKQADFLMSGTSVLSLRGRGQIMTAAGSIDLERYACKITVGLNVAQRVKLASNEVWSPMLDGIEIYLVNGVKSVKLGGMDDTPQYYSFPSNRRKKFAGKDSEGQYYPLVGKTGDYYDTYPMYTYPQQWTYGSTEGYDREPYLKLVVPWTRLEENGFNSTQKQLYYKVLIPDDAREEYKCRFVRNNWYHINIDVSILGAETDEASMTIDPGTCFMVYWQQQEFVIKKAEIGNARYLSVAKESYTLNNVASTVIDYVTSHPVKIVDFTVTRPYYGTKTSGTDMGGSIVVNGSRKYLSYSESQRKTINGGKDWYEDMGTSIIFSHSLKNDLTDASFDYSPYTITFSMVHEDRPTDEKYKKDITIVQYPAVFIEAIPNSDAVNFVWIRKGNFNKQIYESTSNNWGNVYVDNEQIVRPDDKYANITDNNNYYINYWQSPEGGGFVYPNAEEYHWRIVWYTGGSTDIYNINVTVLPNNSSLCIGDPRSSTVDNLRNSDSDPDNNFHEGPAFFDGPTRSLMWYYPAEGSDRTVNMMAPSYCIASEFGDLTMEQAKIRCATFQEDGFPAGRWRLPTQGEIEFIAMLSAKNTFERLFSVGSTYWSANGGVKVNSNSVSRQNPSKALTRCVYDTWYWGKTQYEPRTQFYWGDKER